MSQYTYRDTFEASLKIDWQVADLIGGDKMLDFSKPFLPESMARATPLTFLTPREQRLVNQLRGHNYLYIFGLVEEVILPFVLDHARPQREVDDYRVRALVQFAGEEAKHIQLFKRFREAFQDGFGAECDVIGPPSVIAEAVLAHHPLAVAIAILHIEWMTQGHYLESIKDDEVIDPQFKSLLKHHWMEEAQHAKLDTLLIEAMGESCSEKDIEIAVEEYFEIEGILDAGLVQQVDFDLECFERVTGRVLEDTERRRFVAVQHQAMRWTFLGSGMTHPKFLRTLGKLSPQAREQIEKNSPAFC